MFWSCTAKEDIYKGNFDGKEYEFKQVTKNQGFNKAYSQAFRITGVSNTLTIDAISTSPGYPYSFEIYKKVPHVILDSTSYEYNNKFEDSSKQYVVLYISPDKFKENDFEQFVDFFQTEWQKIKNQVPLNQGYRSLKIVALVYGTDKQFEQRYLNQEETHSKSITVQTDGQILYSESANSVQSTNLSSKIQMPGKKINVKAGGQYTIEALRMFRNKHDRSLELDFELQTD